MAGARDEEEEEVSRSRRKEASQHPECMLSLGRWTAMGYMKLLGIEGLESALHLKMITQCNEIISSN